MALFSPPSPLGRNIKGVRHLAATCCLSLGRPRPFFISGISTVNFGAARLEHAHEIHRGKINDMFLEPWIPVVENAYYTARIPAYMHLKIHSSLSPQLSIQWH